MPDVVHAIAEKRSRGGHRRLAGAPGVGIELAELRLDLVGQPSAHQAAGRRAVLEGGVHPEMGQHLEQVGLAAAEEAADPRRVLPGRSQVGEVAVEDALEGVAELAVTDEGLDLRAELRPSLRVGGVGDSGLAVVGETTGPRVAIEQLVDLHGPVPPPWSVMPLAR